MSKYFKFSPIDSRVNFTSLDCLRGLAAVYVVINHCRGHLYAGGNYLASIVPVAEWSLFDKIYISLLQTTSLGNEFVIFFFILSGFSIAFSIHHSKKLTEFYKRRIVRIYPPYLLGIIWALFILLLIKITIPFWLTCNPSNYTSMRFCEAEEFFELKNILANFFYFPNGSLLAQYWSLPHEIIFYAAVPLFVRSVKTYMVVSTIIYFAMIPVYGINFERTDYKFVDYIIHYNFYFAIGLYLFYYKHLISGVIWNPGKVKFFIIAVFIFLLMVVTKYKLGDFNFVTELLAAILSVVCIKFFLNTNYVPRLLAFLGQFSYTIYIGHFASIYLFKLMLHGFFGYDGSHITNKFIWILGVLFSLLCCYMLYFLAERPSKIYLSNLRKK